MSGNVLIFADSKQTTKTPRPKPRDKYSSALPSEPTNEKKRKRSRKANPEDISKEEHHNVDKEAPTILPQDVSSPDNSETESTKPTAVKKSKQKPVQNKKVTVPTVRLGKDGQRVAQYFTAGKFVNTATGKNR